MEPRFDHYSPGMWTMVGERASRHVPGIRCTNLLRVLGAKQRIEETLDITTAERHWERRLALYRRQFQAS